GPSVGSCADGVRWAVSGCGLELRCPSGPAAVRCGSIPAISEAHSSPSPELNRNHAPRCSTNRRLVRSGRRTEFGQLLPNQTIDCYGCRLLLDERRSILPIENLGGIAGKKPHSPELLERQASCGLKAAASFRHSKRSNPS